MKWKNYLAIPLCIFLTGCAAEPEEPQPKIEIAEIKEPPSEVETLPEESMTEPETLPPAPEEVYISCMPVVEANSTLRLEDFVSFANVTLKDPYMQIETGSLGTFEVSVPYYYGAETREEVVSYEVKDTKAPVILNDGDSAYIPVGEEFDLRNLIGYGDHFDDDLTLTYDGDVDTSVPGSYMLSAYLTDSSGNQSSCRLNVVVGDEEPMEAAGEPVRFQEFKAKYESKKNTLVGVDISSWQGEVDFSALKNAGCEFVMLRVGTSQGYPEQDSHFESNFAAAKKAGLKVGVYFYTSDTSEEQIRADADWIVKQIDNEKLDFPIAFDWEDFTNFQQYEINLHDLNLLYQAFSDQMQTNGYSTMLYSSKYFLENVWENPDKETIWLAHYAAETDYTGKYAMWQRCNTGNIDGIDGNADFDVYTSELLDMETETETLFPELNETKTSELPSEDENQEETSEEEEDLSDAEVEDY